MISVAVGVALACLTLTFVTATTSHSNTPLYTLRMEQVSSHMNFLPTAVNKFTYITEGGYTLKCRVCGRFDGVNPFAPVTDEPGCTEAPMFTCRETICVTTCPTCTNTCPNTCQVSCNGTCYASCYGTCYEQTYQVSCYGTCYDTCWETCVGPYCPVR